MKPPITYFTNYPNPYYKDWRNEPIPGWGVRPVMAGPRMVAVGDVSSAGIAAARPAGFDKLTASLSSSKGGFDTKWLVYGVGAALGVTALLYFVRRRG